MTGYNSAAAPFANEFVPIHYPTGESLVSRVWTTVMNVIPLSLVGERVVAERSGDVLAWVGPLFLEIRALEKLAPDWDSYGARPLNRQHGDRALAFLGRVMTDGLTCPDIVPLADGGIQLEWRAERLDVDYISDEETPEPTLYVTAGGDETEELTGRDAVAFFAHAVHPLLRGETPTLA